MQIEEIHVDTHDPKLEQRGRAFVTDKRSTLLACYRAVPDEPIVVDFGHPVPWPEGVVIAHFDVGSDGRLHLDTIQTGFPVLRECVQKTQCCDSVSATVDAPPKPA